MNRLIALAMVFLIAVTVQAAPVKDGFSGYFDIGMLGLSSNDALSVHDDNEDIDSINENPDSFGAVLPIALFDLKYKKNNLIYHTGTPVESGKSDLSFGVTFLKGEQEFDLSLIIKPMEKVWEDPYISDRESTADRSAGLRFSYKGILGTPHYVEMTAVGHKIEDDKIGERYSEMERDGITYNFESGYEKLVDQGMLTPFVTFELDNRDGDAQSSKSGGLGVKYARQLSTGLLLMNISASYQAYDEENSVFDKTRRDVHARAFAMYKHTNPFGWKKKHISFLAGTKHRMSNIDFYDAGSYFGGVTFGFDF